MATVNTNFAFGAQASTSVIWARQLTAEELASLQAKKGELMAAGKFGSFPVTADSPSTYQWISEEVAQEWVTFCNTFTPAPSSAVVTLLEEPT